MPPPIPVRARPFLTLSVRALEFPHIDPTTTRLLLWFGVGTGLSQLVDIYLIEKCGAEPNAPLYTTWATLVYNWLNAAVCLAGALVIKHYVLPDLIERYPTMPFDEWATARAAVLDAQREAAAKSKAETSENPLQQA